MGSDGNRIFLAKSDAKIPLQVKLYPDKFNGFYTSILEMKDEIISTTSMRIHEVKLAKMPLIVIYKSYRK